MMAEFQRIETAAGNEIGGAMTAVVLRDAQAWAGLQCELLTGIGAL